MNETTKKTNLLNPFKMLLKSEKLGLLIAFVLMVIIFTVMTNGIYLSSISVVNILVSCAIVGLVTIGESYLLISAQVDLSPGSVAAFSGVLMALLLSHQVHLVLAICIVIGVGAVFGVLNGLMVNVLKFEAFIATLATMSIARGLAFIICEGKAIFITNAAFLKIGTGRIGGIPNPVLIFIAFFITFIIILAKTKFGRSVYMVGGNANAARLAGINAGKIKLQLFVLSSCLSALGGIILAARMGTGQPSASDGLEFDAVTAAVLGGIAMTGGKGTLTGALLGLLIMQGFNSGLMMLNVPSFWQTVARGLLLVLALTFDYMKNRKTKMKT